MSALLAFKLGMTSLIDNQGLILPVTVLKVEPNFITQVKTTDSDGYNGLQIATRSAKRIAKPQLKHQAKAGLKQALKYSRELRLQSSPAEDWQIGQEVKIESFQAGDRVTVTGISKGKGFAGTVKRHNFSTTPKSHGAKGHIRKPGSIGSQTPGKVDKGKKMPGRMGHQRVTTKGLEVAVVDSQRQLIAIKGAIPGSRRSLIILKKA